METGEDSYFGAKFLEEVTYINNFIHEDQQIIQEYTNIEHMNAILSSYLCEGLAKCEADFIRQGTSENASSEVDTSRLTLTEVEYDRKDLTDQSASNMDSELVNFEKNQDSGDL